MPTKTINGVKVEYQKSSRKDKKFMTKDPEGKTIHFGAAGYQDYTEHKDQERRDNYRKRHAAIKLKDGTAASRPPKATRAIDRAFSPAWLSYNILWS